MMNGCSRSWTWWERIELKMDQRGHVVQQKIRRLVIWFRLYYVYVCMFFCFESHLSHIHHLLHCTLSGKLFQIPVDSRFLKKKEILSPVLTAYPWITHGSLTPQGWQHSSLPTCPHGRHATLVVRRERAPQSRAWGYIPLHQHQTESLTRSQ